MNIDGHQRISIDNLSPEVDCGKAPIKRIINEYIDVEVDIYGDGHDKVDAVLLFRQKAFGKEKEKKWNETSLKFEGNDRWSSRISFPNTGTYEYTIEAWIDHFATWQYGLRKKYEAGQDIETELKIGAQIIEESISRGNASQKKKLQSWVEILNRDVNDKKSVSLALSDQVTALMYELRDRTKSTRYHKNLEVWVQRKKALFSSWYEFFPRSTAPNPGEHGTFKTSENILPEIARMGFDVIYLPPIHPIGRSFRKGVNNATVAKPEDPGSPWAIGAKEGGHKSLHPELGTMDDFVSLVNKAKELGMEIALDFAIQCSQDHPYVKDHPQWFKWRPDGTVQYAENPPKKYQDVLPVNFETADWENLWYELKSIVEFWIDKGVKIFRVDNPHTKSFIFWEWLIKEINQKYDGIIFLAEAFTRPRVMEKLGKIGFTQSYTYFTWRNTKDEFIEYINELTKTQMREYFRPNFWPNTPDILPISLEDKEEPSFLIRLLLAGTLSSNYGMYGPLFEFGLNEAYPGKEEYTRSEKYEIKHWDWVKPTRIKEIITLLNRVRNENEALQTTWNIEFCETDNDHIICFTKESQDKKNQLIIAINFDPEHTQSGWVKVPLKSLGLKYNQPFAVHDLLTDTKYFWENEWNFVALHPHGIPGHIFRIEKSDKAK
ncbi:MAG TPA: alpha-1,4-glucan--maltose-1-phosphate maltosyltransferase [Gillisia sp.]|nr:alpha-1,4-glucan--maltose-1-phosphate maltosyltransferase [Gillisia sp.]